MVTHDPIHCIVGQTLGAGKIYPLVLIEYGDAVVGSAP